MKTNHILLSLVLLVCSNYLLAQKKLINNDTYKAWKTLQQYNISNNGRYAWYHYGPESGPHTLVVCTTDGKYKREFSGAHTPVFTTDSRCLIFASPKGLTIFEMGKDSIQCIQHAYRHSVPKEGNGRWLSYYPKGGGIILKDLLLSQEKKYPEAKASWFNEQGTIWIVQTTTEILQISLPSGDEKIILQGAFTNDVAFDSSGTKIAFIASGKHGNALRYYQLGMDSASVHVINNSPGIQKGFILSEEPPQFSGDGLKLFFKLVADQATFTIQRDSTVITDKVEVWHYKDKYLLSAQLEEVLAKSRNRTYTAIVPINGRKLIQLESVGNELKWPINNHPGSKYILASNIVDDPDTESHWNKEQISNYQLVSLLNGDRKNILPKPQMILLCQLSLDEKFVIWYDKTKRNYFSYEVATGITRNITERVKVPLYVDYEHNLAVHGNPNGIAGWLSDDTAVLIYDRYDIWQVDPLNRKMPVNVTGAYGRNNGITFRIIGDQFSPITTDTLLLAALNRANKYNGFWRVLIGASRPPIPCSNMVPSLYYFPGVDGNTRPPLKAKNATMYLVQRMSASEASNLFATKDFSFFTALSDVHPEKEYNWMTSELINWKMYDGKAGQGILYKPENFDPKKKYPIIFYYYDKRSHTLFSFPIPGLSGGRLNIPWYVSNGYLVCIPDIYYTVGHTGQSVVNSVESAAKYLSTFAWVDSTKMGLQGHSFGGYETNYLVTHSTMFAAAQPAAGMSDMVRWYGGIAFGGRSTAWQSEVFQSSLGTTPWQRPDIYVENSPVFYLDKVKTPLLIQHNKEDFVVPFEHGLAMFTGLRRLQKPVWLLQYDGMGHILYGEQAKDFTIRQQQFFDHYLKGQPAPEWMLEGIPAKYKGLKSGLGFPGQSDQSITKQ